MVCVPGGVLEFSDAPWVVQAASESFQQGLAIGCFFVIGVVVVSILGLEFPASVLHLVFVDLQVGFGLTNVVKTSVFQRGLSDLHLAPGPRTCTYYKHWSY